jgi:hypothetical protein
VFSVRTIASFLLCLSIFPCHAGKDDGPQFYRRSMMIEVETLDGEKPSFFTTRMRMEPGRHRVLASTGLLFARTTSGSFVGKVGFDFDARSGQSYMLTVFPYDTTIMADSRICLYEEASDDPLREVSGMGSFRHPGPNAIKLECAPLEIFSL